MKELLSVLPLGLILLAYLIWGFRTLPQERWQFIAALPLATRSVMSLVTLGPGAIPRQLNGFVHRGVVGNPVEKQKLVESQAQEVS